MSTQQGAGGTTITPPVPVQPPSQSQVAPAYSGHASAGNSPTAIEAPSPLVGQPHGSSLDAGIRHKREDEFRSLFDLPNATLIDDFSAALQLKSLLLHGRLYIGTSVIAFYSNILGRKTSKVIRFDQLIGLYKRNTAVVFPNAMEIVTLEHNYFFCSFMFRDAAFKMASTAWSDYLAASPSFETHSIVTNSKQDLELYDKSGNSDFNQVKQLHPPNYDDEDLILDGSGGGGGTSNANASGNQDESSPSTGQKRKSISNSRGKTGIDNGNNSQALHIHTSSSQAPDTSDEYANESSTNSTAAVPEIKSSKSKKSKSKRRETIAFVSSNGSKRDSLESNNGMHDDEDIATSFPIPSSNLDSHMAKSRSASITPSPENASSTEKPPTSNQQSNPSTNLQHHHHNSSNNSDSNIGQNHSNEEETPGKPSGKMNFASMPNLPNISETSNNTSNASSHAHSHTQSFDETSSNQPASSSSTNSSAIQLDTSVKIPTNNTCKHCIEEAEDKKITGMTKFGTKTYKNLTATQWFALTWNNPEYLNICAKQFEYSDIVNPAWALSETQCCSHRLLQYKIPLNLSFGPKSTRVDSFQYVRFKTPKHMILETSNISKDVPMGDSFEVHEKWNIIQDGDTLTIDTHCGLFWRKAAWGLKSTINAKSIEGATASYQFVSGAMDTLVKNYQQSLNAATTSSQAERAASPEASKRTNKTSSTAAPPSKKPELLAVEESSSSEEGDFKRSSKSKKKSSKRKGSRDMSSYTQILSVPCYGDKVDLQYQPSTANSQAAKSGLPTWQLALFMIATILVISCFGAIFMITANVVNRIHTLEAGAGRGNQANFNSGVDRLISQQEFKYMRDRIAFLEHLTSALLQNVSDPGSYKSEQYRFWKSAREFESFIGQTGEGFMNLRKGISQLIHEEQEDDDHDTLNGQGEGIHVPGAIQQQSTDEDGSPSSHVDSSEHTQRKATKKPKWDSHVNAGLLLQALKTLPLDRKVLSYLMNPDKLTQEILRSNSQHSNSMANDPATHSREFGSSASSEAHSTSIQWWSPVIFYAGLMIAVFVLVVLSALKLFGIRVPI